MMRRMKEFQTVFDFELPILVEEDEPEISVDQEVAEKTRIDERSNSSTFMENSSSSAGDLFSNFDNYTSQPGMTSGSVVSDFLSPSESTSFSLEEGDCSPSSTGSDPKSQCRPAIFSSVHAPFSSHLGLISDKLERKEKEREFHRSASAGNNHRSSTSKLWTDNGSAKTLPSRMDKSKPTTIFDSIHTNGDSNKLRRAPKAGKNKNVLEGMDDDKLLLLLPNATPEQKVQALEKELKKAREVILEKEQKCAHLMKLQNSVDSEVQDLTETLFQVRHFLE